MSIDTRLDPSLSQFDALTALDRQAGLREGQIDGLAGTGLVAETAPAADLVDQGERLLNARAWDEGEPRQFSTGDFHPAGHEPADDLALVDQLVDSI
jgi:hypothetical protein